jgi:hypothetical protein
MPLPPMVLTPCGLWGFGSGARPGSVLPGVARRAPAQRLPSGATTGGDRDGLGDRRTVRRHPLRHGHNLLKTIYHDAFRNGQWRFCNRSSWPDNQSCRNILAWCWVKDEERVLIVVNFSDRTSQALIHVPWDELRGKMWRLTDALSGEVCERSGNKMRDSGLYVDLPSWGYHVFALGS